MTIAEIENQIKQLKHRLNLAVAEKIAVEKEMTATKISIDDAYVKFKNEGIPIDAGWMKRAKHFHKTQVERIRVLSHEGVIITREISDANRNLKQARHLENMKKSQDWQVQFHHAFLKSARNMLDKDTYTLILNDALLTMPPRH